MNAGRVLTQASSYMHLNFRQHHRLHIYGKWTDNNLVLQVHLVAYITESKEESSELKSAMDKQHNASGQSKWHSVNYWVTLKLRGFIKVLLFSSTFINKSNNPNNQTHKISEQLGAQMLWPPFFAEWLSSFAEWSGSEQFPWVNNNWLTLPSLLCVANRLLTLLTPFPPLC